MSIERVRNGKVIPPANWGEGYTSNEYALIVPVKLCSVCGENLLDDSFVFWRGYEPMGFHAECARHMCLGLLRDVSELTGTLAHSGKIRSVILPMRDKSDKLPKLQKAYEETLALVKRYSARIVELQELLAKR